MVATPGELSTGSLPVRVVEGRERSLIPGIVDPLTHPCGGGGEGGFGNRTAELSADHFLAAGITTPVGALGTDSITRSLDVLYGNVMQLRARGLNAAMYTGAYRVPAPTLTGDVARDLLLVEPVIGVGEIAISDHRSSAPSVGELARLATDVAIGGTLSGKKGTVFVHVGGGGDGLEPLNAVLDSTDLEPGVFMATHCNRSRELIQQAAAFTRRGGHADLTVSTTPELVAHGDIPALEALEALETEGAVMERVTLSSDAGGSLPHYVNGELRGITAARPSVMPDLLAAGRQRSEALFVQVLSAMTERPARALGLRDRGIIEPGSCADLVLLDEDRSVPVLVFGRGALRYDRAPDG
jgi:beta-aspartyl-dipeptidase (metallo-type)